SIGLVGLAPFRRASFAAPSMRVLTTSRAVPSTIAPPPVPTWSATIGTTARRISEIIPQTIRFVSRAVPQEWDRYLALGWGGMTVLLLGLHAVVLVRYSRGRRRWRSAEIGGV